jgi:NodT family efflux transporter outer membrane factor (OMF) lipoprotein
MFRFWFNNLGRAEIAVVAIAGAFMFLISCSVGPDYVRPTAAAPDAFKELNGWKRAQPKEDAIRGAWWEMFNDQQLNALEEKINISNQNIIAADASFQQARALVREARAAYFPTATASPSYTRSRVSQNTTSATSRQLSAGITSNYLLSGDVTWELDLWGKVRRTVEANRASAQASAADLEGVRLSAQAELAQDYFQLRALDSQKKLLDETIISYQTSLELTKNRYDSGVASKGDVVIAETQLKTTQAQSIDLGVQRAQFEHAIATLIGTPASNFSIPPTPLTDAPPSIPLEVPSELLERRPDIAGAERRVASANAQIGVAEAAYYPTVTLTASGGFQASDFAKWLSWPSRFWSLGAAASELLFDAGLRRAQTDQARAAHEGTVAVYRQTVLTAFQEVEDNLAALRILEEEARVQDEAVKAAEQSVTVTTNQYKAGIVNYLNVVTVQVIALNNEKTAVAILGSRLSSAVLLIKALGGAWNASALPSGADLAERDHKRPQAVESKPMPVDVPDQNNEVTDNSGINRGKELIKTDTADNQNKER